MEAPLISANEPQMRFAFLVEQIVIRKLMDQKQKTLLQEDSGGESGGRSNAEESLEMIRRSSGSVLLLACRVKKPSSLEVSSRED